ncbi:MAG: hypothetical protein ACYS8Y_05955 [Planctomycetota bacterium]|jgi:uncharacterized protein YjeT (DUF2065 family)
MSNLALISIIFGILIIVGRVPLVFAPDTALKFIRRVINKNIILRIVAIPTALLGSAMIISAWGSDQSTALIILLLGSFIAFMAVLELFFTSFIQRIANHIWNMDNLKARILGLFSVVIGAFFIYLGLVVF